MAKIDELFADISSTMKMPITDPKTDEVICDKDGKESFLEFLPPDHPDVRKREVARSKQVQKTVAKQGRKGVERMIESEDPIENRAEAVANRLGGQGWYLVSPSTREPIDLPFSQRGAAELLAKPQMGWLLRKAEAYLNEEADFIKPSSENSLSSQGGNSAEG
jgi:hypothetical protein